MIVGRFAEVCKMRGLKVNAGTGKGMVLNGDEMEECKCVIWLWGVYGFMISSEW